MELSETTAENPDMRFNQWTEETFPNLDTETKTVIAMIYLNVSGLSM